MTQHKMLLSDHIPNNLLGAFDPVNHHSQEVGIVRKPDELWRIPAFPHMLALFAVFFLFICPSESPRIPP